MNSSHATPTGAVHLTKLAACAAALFGFSAPAANAVAHWPVTTCADHGAGSLRDVIAASTTLSGEVVDMTGLGCSLITLDTGAITIAQGSLTIIGPPAGTLSVNYGGAGHDRIFLHTGGGQLYLKNFNMAYGYVAMSGTAAGGCVYSVGALTMYGMSMRHCTAYSSSSFASGGGGAAYGGITMKYTVVSDNYASGAAAFGGALYSAGPIVAGYSTIDGNRAVTGSPNAYGGAVFSVTGANLTHSTVSNNYASTFGGGIFVTGGYLTMFSSTVSGNSAGVYAGGILAAVPIATIFDSTIAFNTAASGGGGGYSPGLSIPVGAPSLSLKSSLLSNNTYGPNENDLTAGSLAEPAVFNAGSAKNFIRAAPSVSGLPGDTKTGFCPMLGPLRDNGGRTPTHQLFSGSIAIDAGISSETYDQRGPSYGRTSAGVPDIGAYEVQQDDIVFNVGFDGCPILF